MEQRILHTYECKAASHTGAKRGDRRNVAAGSPADLRLTADPAWKRVAVVAVDPVRREHAEATGLIDQARAALEAGERGAAAQHLRRALALLDEKERDSGVAAQAERAAKGLKTEQARSAAAKEIVQSSAITAVPGKMLSRTELTQANKSELLIALRTMGAYVPGMEARKNDELRDTLREAYGYTDEGAAAATEKPDEAALEQPTESEDSADGEDHAGETDE